MSFIGNTTTTCTTCNIIMITNTTIIASITRFHLSEESYDYERPSHAPIPAPTSQPSTQPSSQPSQQPSSRPTASPTFPYHVLQNITQSASYSIRNRYAMAALTSTGTTTTNLCM